MAKTIQKYFPFSPDHSTWDEFNGNLFLYYGEFNIIRSNEEHWAETAQGLNQTPAFATYPVPNVDTFANWQDWARAFITVVNGPSY
jgi:hypothetical protein